MSEDLGSSLLDVPSPAIKEPPTVSNAPAVSIENHPNPSSVQTNPTPQEEAKPAIEPPVAVFTSKGIVHPSKVSERGHPHRKRTVNSDSAQPNTIPKKSATAAKALADKPAKPTHPVREPIIVTIKRPPGRSSQKDSAPKETPGQIQLGEESKTTPPKNEPTLENEKRTAEIATNDGAKETQAPQDKKAAKPSRKVIMKLFLKKPTTPKPEETQEPPKVAEPPREKDVEVSKSTPDQVPVQPPVEEVPRKLVDIPTEKVANPDPVPDKTEEISKETKAEETQVESSTKPPNDKPAQESSVPQEPDKPTETSTVPENLLDLPQEELTKDIEKMEESNSALIQEGISHLIESMNEKLFQTTPSEEIEVGAPNSGPIRVDMNTFHIPSNFVQIIPIPRDSRMIIENGSGDRFTQITNVFQNEPRIITEKEILNDSIVQVIPRRPEIPIDKLIPVDIPTQDKKGTKQTKRILMKFTLGKSPTPKSEFPKSVGTDSDRALLKSIEKTPEKPQKNPEKTSKREAEKGKTPGKTSEKKSEKTSTKKNEKTPEKTRSKSNDKTPEKKPEKAIGKTPEKAIVKASSKTPAKKSTKEEQKSNKTPQKQGGATIPKPLKKKVQEKPQTSDSETETETDTDYDCMLDSNGRMGTLPPSKRIKIDLFNIENEINQRRYLTAAFRTLNTRSEIIATLIENANAEWSEVRKSKTKRNGKS